MLAGVSVTWYTWLEQGRRINASTDVLRDRQGAASRRRRDRPPHRLAQPATAAPADVGTYGPEHVPSALRRLITAFEPAPAYVLGPRWSSPHGTPPRRGCIRGSRRCRTRTAICCGRCSPIRRLAS